MKYDLQLFKVLVDGKSCHGGEYKYPPLGRWTPAVDPSICSTGYHLTSDPLAWWKPKAALYIAEGKGKIDGDGQNKLAFEQVRLLEQVLDKSPILVAFPRLRAFLAASARSVSATADISWANLSGANLSEANLSRANLSWANLSWANLSGANLSGADLSGADLSWANLSGANLSRANLSWANLSWANLSGANLSRANLSRANLSRANLSGADQPPAGWKRDPNTGLLVRS